MVVGIASSFVHCADLDSFSTRPDGNDAADLVRTIGSPKVKYLYCAPHTFHMGGDIAPISANDQIRCPSTRPCAFGGYI